MICKHFSICGSCNLYDIEYQKALDIKKNRVSKLLEPFYSNNIDIFSSPMANHRARAEFKIWHIDNSCYYAMSNITKDGITILNECPKVIKPIENIQYKLLKMINSSEILRKKLFSIEFLAGLSGEVLVTMIYHKVLDKEWEKEAKELEDSFGISIIGRARKQKIVLSKEYITEKVEVNNRSYIYKHYEGGFTQPNPYINQKMISWALDIANGEDDFLEAYCGLGNFTIPLSTKFNKVLATEISKNSIRAAKENCALNEVNNIEFIRMDASDTADALNGKRAFRRLKDINLQAYNFSTILVDPPRAGLDENSINLAKKIKNIIYISCNPETLARDLKELCQTHKVVRAAMFDQFPYTNHIESGVYLERI